MLRNVFRSRKPKRRRSLARTAQPLALEALEARMLLSAAPTASPDDVYVGDTYAFTANDFGYGDSDGDRFDHLTVQSLPSRGTLLNGGSPVSVGQNIATGIGDNPGTLVNGPAWVAGVTAPAAGLDFSSLAKLAPDVSDVF